MRRFFGYSLWQGPRADASNGASGARSTAYFRCGHHSTVVSPAASWRECCPAHAVLNPLGEACLDPGGASSPCPPSSPAHLLRSPVSKVITGNSWRIRRCSARCCCEADAHGGDSANLVRVFRREFRASFCNGAQIAVGPSLNSRYCSTLTTTLIGKELRHQIFDQLREALFPKRLSFAALPSSVAQNFVMLEIGSRCLT